MLDFITDEEPEVEVVEATGREIKIIAADANSNRKTDAREKAKRDEKIKNMRTMKTALNQKIKARIRERTIREKVRSVIVDVVNFVARFAKEGHTSVTYPVMIISGKDDELLFGERIGGNTLTVYFKNELAKYGISEEQGFEIQCHLYENNSDIHKYSITIKTNP